MSTRWYPIYQRGGPQLRVFLPNFWVKLIRPTHEQPPNVVQFACSMEMSPHDVRNYLEKIYNLKIAGLRIRTAQGPTRKTPVKGYVVKDDDTKIAYVTLPKGEKFVFPDLFPEDVSAKKDEESTLKEAKKSLSKFLEQNKERPNVPGWFSL